MNKHIIFLDIDGVLNVSRPHPGWLCNPLDHDKVERLNRILSATEARFVLVSGWRWIVNRDVMTLAGLEWLFQSHGILPGRLTGITRLETLDASGQPLVMERGLHVAEWRDAHDHIGPYVVIDDVDLGHSAAGHPFIHTDPDTGLTDADTEAAIAILGHTDS